MGYYFVWLDGTQPCWLTPPGSAVPLSIHNNVPYLEDQSKPWDSLEALSAVGLSRNRGHVVFSLNIVCNQWAVAVATHEPDDDVSWDVGVGRQDGKDGG